MGVDAGAHGGAAEGQFPQVVFRGPQPGHAVLNLAGVTTKFLAEPDGRGVLQMGAANFEDAVKFLRLALQSLAQGGQGRDEAPLHRLQRGDVDGRWNRVVAGLAAVDVVVGMDLFAAALAAHQLDGAVGDDLIGVHVGRGAGAGLENVQHEFAVPLSIGHFLRCLGNDAGQLQRQAAQFLVGQSGVLLDQAQRADKGTRKTQVADGKILHRPRRLRAIIGAGGNLHRPHGVALASECFAHK